MIINPKTNFPTNVEFYAIISTFRDRVVATVKCLHCEGKMHIELNVPKDTDATKIQGDWIKQRVLEVAAKRHSCLYKASMWGDKNLLQKIGGDILRGMDKLKEQQYRFWMQGRGPGNA